MSIIDPASSTGPYWGHTQALKQSQVGGQKTAEVDPAAAGRDETPEPRRQTIRAAQQTAPARADGEEPSALDKIREQGFQAYAEEVREEKIQELREKILESMGLTEEDLENMPPEQRATIEKIVANEIVRRMRAQSEFNGGDEGNNSKHKEAMAVRSADATGTSVSAAATGFGDAGLAVANGTAMDEAGVGLGPLLALQEVEDAEKSDQDSVWSVPGEHGKNGRREV